MCMSPIVKAKARVIVRVRKLFHQDEAASSAEQGDRRSNSETNWASEEGERMGLHGGGNCFS